MSRILIVDDEKSIRLTLREFLQAAGYNVELAEDATVALKLLQSNTFDVVVSDIILPRFSGVKLLSEIKNVSPRTQVVLITGEPTLETATESLRHGAFDYLSKPITKVDILKTVRNAVNFKETKDARRRLEAEKLLYTEHLEQTVAERTRSLQESEERLITVLNSIDAHVYVADMKGHEVLFMNKGMQDSFGGDLTGETCWKVFRDQTQPCEHCNNDQLIDKQGRPTGVCVWEGQNPVTNKWYLNYDRAINWSDGRVVRLQVATDITKLKESEKERQLVEKQLRQAQRMEAIGTLAAGIAHDFNNILSAVIGFSELALDETPENSKAESHVREILQAGHRAKELVHHILTFSRQAEPEFTYTQIKPLLNEALKFLRATLPPNIEVRQNLQSNSAVLGDPTQIHQIIMNLCTNAAQAMPDGGILTIGLMDTVAGREEDRSIPGFKPGKYVVLSVGDIGHGIPPEIMDRIFDPFFTTKKKGEGTGMGLSVVHGIVSGCQGKIQVDSQPGKGTTFQVFLPVLENHREERLAPSSSLPTGSERILVVDDEPVIVRAAGLMLESLGYTVETRTDAIKAQQRVSEQPDRFDLVITDMLMPKMTGDMLAKSLHKINADLPVILCTGFGEKIEDREIRKSEFRAVVKKPFLKRTLAEVVRGVLDRKVSAKSC